MNPLHRGILEQYIDTAIEEESLKMTYVIFEKFKKLYMIDSIESAMFADIFSRTTCNFRLLYLDREPTSKDLNEFTELFESRASQIKSRITEICNL